MREPSHSVLMAQLPPRNEGGVERPKEVVIFQYYADHKGSFAVMRVTAPDGSLIRVTINLDGGVFDGTWCDFKTLWGREPAKGFLYDIAAGYYATPDFDKWGVKVTPWEVE